MVGQKLRSPLRLGAVLCIAATSGAGLGCRANVRAPERIPTFQIDTQASEVRATGPHTSNQADAFRKGIAWALTDMMQARSNVDEAPPARFTAKMSYDVESWPAAACLVVLSFFGCPLSRWTIDMDLVLEVDGKVYRGSGSHSSAAGIYYNQDGFLTIAGATEKALEAALDDAQQQSKVAKNNRGEAGDR